MVYKKDTLIGTWVAIAIFLGCGFAALIHFEQLTIIREMDTIHSSAG